MAGDREKQKTMKVNSGRINMKNCFYRWCVCGGSTIIALSLFSGAASAISTGTDLNLSSKAASGGMGGAAYIKPQEISAAVFGNPATLTQFNSNGFNFGASLLQMESVSNTQTADIPNVGKFSNTSESLSDNYILPDFGASLVVSQDMTVGVGLEVDAGIGSDFRDDPIKLLGGAGDFSVPLLVELISLNSNIGFGYRLTPTLSVGAAVTVGFGFAQLGTAGPTENLDALCGALGTDPVLCDFGGSTSSAHDIALGGSIGMTSEHANGVTIGMTYKSKTQYNFEKIIYSGVNNDWQDLKLEQPAEWVLGVALDDTFTDGLLIEADLIFKNWQSAAAYEDVYKDQLLVSLGSQYSSGEWHYRLGYSYAQDILKDKPNSTLNGLGGVGSIPLGNGAFEPVSTDVIGLVQQSLLPVIWNHTVTAGIGYDITSNLRLDTFVAYAFSEGDSYNAATIAGAADGAFGQSGTSVKYESDVGYELLSGLGINYRM